MVRFGAILCLGVPIQCQRLQFYRRPWCQRFYKDFMAPLPCENTSAAWQLFFTARTWAKPHRLDSSVTLLLRRVVQSKTQWHSNVLKLPKSSQALKTFFQLLQIKRLQLKLTNTLHQVPRTWVKQHPKTLQTTKQTKIHLQALPCTNRFHLVPNWFPPGSFFFLCCGRSRSTVALPVAISHKASLKPKRSASATLIQKTSKNEPKHGPKNGTAWRSHFWDRMHSKVKEQKKSTFTAVPFLGPSGGTKNETAKSKKQQQRPTRATNKKWQLRLVSNKHIELEQRRPAHTKPDFNWLSGPRNGTWKRTCGISCLRSLAPMRRLQCSTTQATFTNPSLLRATPLLRGMF